MFGSTGLGDGEGWTIPSGEGAGVGSGEGRATGDGERESVVMGCARVETQVTEGVPGGVNTSVPGTTEAGVSEGMS